MAPSSNHNCLTSVTTTIAQPCHMLLLNKRCKQHTSCVCQLFPLDVFSLSVASHTLTGILHTGMSKVSSTFVTSTPAKMAAVSLMPGRRSASSSGGRWLRCRWMWSPSGPHPRPSLISMVIDRDTTSRDARSFAVGAYLHNRDQANE